MTGQTRRWVVGGVVAALALAVLTIGVAGAQQTAGQSGRVAVRGGRTATGAAFLSGGGRGLAALRMGLAQLNLTDQQKAQVKGILQGHREKVRGFAAQGREARLALRDAVATGADETTIRAKAADLARVQADLAVFGAQLRTEILGVLTPEQQAKARELRLKALDRAEKKIERLKNRAGVK